MLDRHATLRGRRPFAWLRRVTNLNKSSPSKPAKTKPSSRKHDPYPQSSHLHRPPAASSVNGVSFSTPATQSFRDDASFLSYEDAMLNGSSIPLRSNQSAAPTFVTHADTIASSSNQSKTGTAVTAGGISILDGEGGGRGSTFSSPNHSDRSLTTTLTTIQSAAPSAVLNHQPNGFAQAQHNQTITFTQPFPTSPAPLTASAIPPHLQAPRTYESAIANGLNTDNASILTLASSTKRRRRHSLDTNASVRALAPNSLYNASRESLPMSILSSQDMQSPQAPNTTRPSVSLSFGGAERASVYSNTGALPQSERNSYYANPKTRNDAMGDDGRSIRSGYGPSIIGRESMLGGKADSIRYLGDAASVRSVKSGHMGHARQESYGASGWASPLASPGLKDKDKERDGESA